MADFVYCKRIYIMNDDIGGYMDIYPRRIVVKFTDWDNPCSYQVDLKELYQKLHVCCGMCYLDLKHMAKVELEPLYEDFGSGIRERMVMIEFNVTYDSSRAKISFRDLVEAIYFWIG